MLTDLQRERFTAFWMKEEVEEFAAAKTAEERLDAVLDLLGVVCLYVSFSTRTKVDKALIVYQYAQLSRGRTIGWWHSTIEAFMHDRKLAGAQGSTFKTADAVLEAKAKKANWYW